MKSGLLELKKNHLLRELPSSNPQKINLSLHSNDYLNLAKHPNLIKALQYAAGNSGISSTGSRLLSGNHSLFETLERNLATFTGYEKALVFNCGYQLNLGVISTLYGKNDLILADKYIHASLLDGMQLSQATFKRFKHNDTAHLLKLLITYRKQFDRCLIVSESLFSMDGDTAPINKLSTLCSDFNAQLMIDEAHSIGVLGPHGKGLTALSNVKPDYLIGTFGKAFGSQGAFIASNATSIDYLINHCRSFIYSTALPLPVIAATQAALDLMPTLDFQRQKLSDISAYFCQQLTKFNIPFLGHHHIISVLLAGNKNVVSLKNNFQKQHINVAAIRHPTVPKGKERLRFSLTSQLTTADIDLIIEQLHASDNLSS